MTSNAVFNDLAYSDLHIAYYYYETKWSSNRLNALATPYRILGQVNIVFTNDQLHYNYTLQIDRLKTLTFLFQVAMWVTL